MNMNNNYKQYIKYLLYSLLLTTLGSFVGNFIPITFILIYAFASLILLIAFFFTKGKAKKILFYIFSFGEGVCLAPILLTTTNTSLFACLAVTTLTVAIFSIIGFKVKDLGFLKNILFIGLLIFLFYSLIAFFIPLPPITLIGIVLFCLYVAYDINKFKNAAGSLNEDEVLNEVMDIYLDIINLFLLILKLFED